VQTPIAQLLRKNANFLGEAFVAGTLFDLGRYPGLITNKQTKSKVTGHLFEIPNTELIFPVLDEYEGVDGFNPDRNGVEYRREIIEVSHQNALLTSWTYLYNLPTKGLKIIESGNYLEYLQKNREYQRFINQIE
ncbi:MAG: gamma-glutamylcyclotransferase family protein, partial [Bacteroidota bacterium]